MNETTIFETLNKWNEQLSGAPSGVLVFFLVIALAFALRWWDLFPDKYVAPVSTLGGMILFCLLAPYAQEHMRIWLVKNAILGFIISFAASFAILKFGARLPVIGKFLSEDTENKTTKEP